MERLAAPYLRESVERGIPPHPTILFPFVPGAEIDDEVLVALRRLQRLPCVRSPYQSLVSVEAFPDAAWLAPRPVEKALSGNRRADARGVSDLPAVRRPAASAGRFPTARPWCRRRSRARRGDGARVASAAAAEPADPLPRRPGSPTPASSRPRRRADHARLRSRSRARRDTALEGLGGWLEVTTQSRSAPGCSRCHPRGSRSSGCGGSCPAPPPTWRRNASAELRAALPDAAVSPVEDGVGGEAACLPPPGGDRRPLDRPSLGATTRPGSRDRDRPGPGVRHRARIRRLAGLCVSLARADDGARVAARRLVWLGRAAIAAARLGFAPVLAIDVDPVAVETTRANAEANGVGLDARVVDALTQGCC